MRDWKSWSVSIWGKHPWQYSADLIAAEMLSQQSMRLASSRGLERQETSNKAFSPNGQMDMEDQVIVEDAKSFTHFLKNSSDARHNRKPQPATCIHPGAWSCGSNASKHCRTISCWDVLDTKTPKKQLDLDFSMHHTLGKAKPFRLGLSFTSCTGSHARRQSCGTGPTPADIVQLPELRWCYHPDAVRSTLQQTEFLNELTRRSLE